MSEEKMLLRLNQLYPADEVAGELPPLNSADLARIKAELRSAGLAPDAMLRSAQARICGPEYMPGRGILTGVANSQESSFADPSNSTTREPKHRQTVSPISAAFRRWQSLLSNFELTPILAAPALASPVEHEAEYRGWEAQKPLKEIFDTEALVHVIPWACDTLRLISSQIDGRFASLQISVDTSDDLDAPAGISIKVTLQDQLDASVSAVLSADHPSVTVERPALQGELAGFKIDVVLEEENSNADAN